MGKGLRVSARLTTIPEKKNGTAMQRASSVQLNTEVSVGRTTAGRTIWTQSDSPRLIANAVLKTVRSYESVASVNRSRRR